MTDTVAVPVWSEPARSTAARRWRKWRLALLVAVSMLLSSAILVIAKPAVSNVPFAVDNPGDDGVRALAQVLGDQGVEVTQTRNLDTALALAQPGTTLAVVTSFELYPYQAERLADTEADLVLIGVDDPTLDRLTDGTVVNAWSENMQGKANCSDPDAQAAGSISTSAYALNAIGPEVITCFTTPNGSVGAYAVTAQGGRPVRVFSDTAFLTNSAITEAGNAALALRVLGSNDRLTWYLPSYSDNSSGNDSVASGSPSVLPPGSDAVVAWLATMLLVLAVWRGRAMGRVVEEPLPVIVRAAETTRGRGRLYRKARARGHAAASLRAGTARRSAARLGLPRSASGAHVIDALAGATGRPTDQVAALLYGPPPITDDELGHLARALDELESEVHRT